MSYKTCIFCDEKIRPTHVLCGKHYIYKQYADTEWFKELVRLQARQDTISRHEVADIPFTSATTIRAEQPEMRYQVKKEVGRPATDWRIVKQILQLYDQSLEDVKQGRVKRKKSLRTLAKEVHYRIGYYTVRNIIKKYRGTVEQHGINCVNIISVHNESNTE